MSDSDVLTAWRDASSVVATLKAEALNAALDALHEVEPLVSDRFGRASERTSELRTVMATLREAIADHEAEAEALR